MWLKTCVMVNFDWLQVPRVYIISGGVWEGVSRGDQHWNQWLGTEIALPSKGGRYPIL